MEEYLTTTELSYRIKMAPGTIRNLVWKNEFKEHIHYVKPTPRKILFLWNAIEAWLFNRSNESLKYIPEKDQNECRIKI
jgi:hypothetical protein